MIFNRHRITITYLVPPTDSKLTTLTANSFFYNVSAKVHVIVDLYR